jgi:hypothetical protein
MTGTGLLTPPIPSITVVVHPIDREKHPDIPEGYRWAVMVGGRPPREVEWCANAGWCPTKGEAAFEGEMVGAGACRAARMLGVPADYGVLYLEYDPIPENEQRVGRLGA